MESIAQPLPETGKRVRWHRLRGLSDCVSELWRCRELFRVLAGRDLKVRYKQSLLGAAWAILQPASMTFVFTIVFGYFLKTSDENIPLPLFFYVTTAPWAFLAASLGASVGSLVNNLSLVTKVRFPREILVIAGIGALGVDFLIALCLFPLLLLVWPISMSLSVLWLPLLLTLQILLITGIGLIIAASNVFYRDLRFLVPLGLQLWFFASPVMYSVSMVPERFRRFYMLNPMAPILNGYRETLLYGNSPQLGWLVLAALTSIFIFILGYWAFKRLEPAFADVI
ncbi:MAG: ABC transporter permease [Armatimonadetes bacterium]|nr:ABC transporter permease [Armatimonadota bacterium]NIM24832.1 ABC transporter permease [Armatimonadota bacterium]NIM68722.1 ABC transporter permease [Armatimonadota bacterium]NIM76015.1 ABC transporter permease [Armatimonadota bacterium]NIN06919.1 ABC transporter permease [Armatimonadota bacterium]